MTVGFTDELGFLIPPIIGDHKNIDLGVDCWTDGDRQLVKSSFAVLITIVKDQTLNSNCKVSHAPFGQDKIKEK